MIPSISGCGTYIALVRDNSVQIHVVNPPTLFRTFNLDRCFAQHRQNSNVASSPTQSGPITVHSLEWEVPTTEKCGKIAAYASDSLLQLVLVFDFVLDLPLVIEVDQDEPSHIQWIPGASLEGAYVNCSQLAVFTDLGIEMRVYSLDCTVVQFTVPKPVFNSIIVRPGDSHVWSVVASPYYEKTLAARSILADPARELPALLHFHSSGSVSSLLANLALDFSPNLDSLFQWSPSGSWLLYFDDSSSLCGYRLKFFNLLGIHSRPIKSSSENLAQATLEYSDTTSLATSWISAWGQVGNIEYATVVAAKTSKTIELKAYAVSQASTTRKISIDLTKGRNWTCISDTNRSPLYRETFAVAEPTGQWRTFTDLGQRLLLASDNFVAVILVKVATPLHFEAEYTVSSPLLLLEAFPLSSSEVILVFADHVAVLTSHGSKVLATSRYRFKSVRCNTANGATFLVLVEDTPSGPVWRQVVCGSDSSEDSNLEIMDRFDYQEESSKVVRLMRDAQHSEWALPARRRPDDVTDTFHLNSKRRRSVGTLRSNALLLPH